MAVKIDKVLWADDEIDLLKPHILFLQDKGYEVVPVVSGQDAIDCCKEQSFDIIFLDENMPGLTGLETLSLIKEIDPNVPVVMVTKSEEESIMNQAIGNKIADYLIKPVNPNQLLLSIKKNVHKNVIISETTTVGYQQEFGRIGMQIKDCIQKTLDPLGAMVVIEAQHMCMQMRGVEKQNSLTTTSDFTGFFQQAKTREEFMNLIKRNR